MSARVEAAAKAYFENAGDCTYRDAFRLTLAAADAVMFSEAAIERAAKAVAGDFPWHNNYSPEVVQAHVRAVVAALREGA
jgi:hypothetical protein